MGGSRRLSLQRLVPIFVASLVLAHCARERSTDYDRSEVYFSSVESIVLEVVYEPGAEPYTGNFAGAGALATTDVWSLFESNIAALFQGRPTEPQLFHPPKTAAMRAIPKQNTAQWTVAQLYELAEQYRQERSTATEAHFFVAFLRGKMTSTVKPKPGKKPGSLLGVHISGTPYVFLFKDEIESAAKAPGDSIARFVEQSVLVHEISHALGLVNLGIPLRSAHEGHAEEKAHCTRRDCVMYWANDGLGDMATFALKFLTTGNLVLFGPECLQDARRFLRR